MYEKFVMNETPITGSTSKYSRNMMERCVPVLAYDAPAEETVCKALKQGSRYKLLLQAVYRAMIQATR